MCTLELIDKYLQTLCDVLRGHPEIDRKIFTNSLWCIGWTPWELIDKYLQTVYDVLGRHPESDK